MKVLTSPDNKVSTGLNKDSRLPQLDGLRAIAFLMVFFYHAPVIPQTDKPNWLISAVNYVFSSGWTGVDLFFVLSGFLITTLLLREKYSFNSVSIKLFFTRRALRIWPVYYTFLVITCLVLTPILSHELSLKVYERFLLQQFVPLCFFVGNFSFIADQHTISRVSEYLSAPAIWLNAALIPLWSLCVEWQFYAIWPFVVNKIKQPKTLTKLILATIAASFILRIICFAFSIHFIGQKHILYYMNTFCHLDPLMIGALIATAYVYHPEFITKIRLEYLFIATILFAIPHYYWGPNISANAWTTVPLFFTGAMAFGGFLLLSLRSEAIKKFLSLRILRSIGGISFTMYVLHDVVLKVSTYVFKDMLHLPETTWYWLILVSTSWAITYVIAQLSWIFLESKMLLLRHKYSR